MYYFGAAEGNTSPRLCQGKHRATQFSMAPRHDWGRSPFPPARERFSLQLGLTSLLTENLYIAPTMSFGLNGPGSHSSLGVSLPYTFGF